MKINYDTTWYPVVLLNHEFDRTRAGWARLIIDNSVPIWAYHDIRERQLIDFEDPEFTGSVLSGLLIHETPDKKSYSGFHQVETKGLRERMLYRIAEIRARNKLTLPTIEEIYNKFKKPTILWTVQRGPIKAWILEPIKEIVASIIIEGEPKDEDQVSYIRDNRGSLEIYTITLEYDRMPKLEERKIGHYTIRGNGRYLRWKNKAVVDGKVKIINANDEKVLELSGQYMLQLDVS